MSFAEAERGVAFPSRSRAATERIYRRALRHSRNVRRLRIGLLAVIVGLLLTVITVNYMPPVGGFRLPEELGKLVIKGTKITMQQPHLTGYTADSRAYQFSANTAAQDITRPDLVDLQQIRAQMEMADKTVVHMWADTGLYNMKTTVLTLNENIRLVSSTGYEARLTHAVIDMTKGTVVSDDPVAVKLLDGTLNSKRLEIVDKGDVVRFSDVTMMLQSGNQETKRTQP